MRSLVSWFSFAFFRLASVFAGDPQTAVSHLGDVVLFIQYVLAKFKVSHPKFFFLPNLVCSYSID